MIFYSSVSECSFEENILVDCCDLLTTMSRPIEYNGRGWHSTDDNKVYHKGTFAIYSRIKLI